MELKGDPQRIEAFRRGDKQVLTELYRAHVSSVERFIRSGFTFSSRGKTIRFNGFYEPFRVQETLQDAFLKAFKKEAREGYDGSKPWRPYLMMIVRNHVIDQFRSSRTEQRYFVALADIGGSTETENETLERLQVDREANSPEMTAFRSQLGGVLKIFMDELDPMDMEVVQRHMLGDMTQQQLAEHLGESRNDVRKRIKSIRAKLLRHLKTQGVIKDLDAKQLLGDLALLAGVLVR